MVNDPNSKVDFYHKMLKNSNSCTSETDIQIDVLLLIDLLNTPDVVFVVYLLLCFIFWHTNNKKRFRKTQNLTKMCYLKLFESLKYHDS